MKSASPNRSQKCSEFDIWLDVGMEGRCFTYKDGLNLGVDLGDIVLVRLKGRRINGLVLDKRIYSIHCKDTNKKLSTSLLNIEAVVQRAAVDSNWREWLEAMARRCYVSPFRMIKAALPPGWLGHAKSYKTSLKKLWWIGLKEQDFIHESHTPRQKELINELISCGGGAWMRDLERKGYSFGLIKTLNLKGNVFREKRPLPFVSHATSVDSCFSGLEEPESLTQEQKSAIKAFTSLSPGSALLLWGVTGSGKTEVYLQIAEKELAAGRNCLILTPEIGLVPQLVDRFVKRFGSKVLEYHSNRSAIQRVNVWKKSLNSSTPSIVIGTRSAVFLPLSPLGLIVLDEEHDSSYKQESPMPCYHARDLALDRAKRIGAKVLMGTATPSLTIWKDVSPNGPISIAKLNSRILDRELPSVQVVDMRKEFASNNRSLISRQLLKELLKLKETDSQAIVLVPRRGYSSFLSCRCCGDVVQCPNCDVALTVHMSTSGGQWLRCHWCDFRAGVKASCNECGSKAFKPFGTGTQRVMETLERELAGMRLLRFDRDTTTGRDGHRNILKKFALGEADILVGTQMLSKGIDLPNVTLAVVLAADGLLHRPDLLAGEQTLQLFLQLAGRAGRGEQPGKVLLQTYCPQHPVILHFVDGRYEEFLKKEEKLRRDSGLVPYKRACLLRLSGESSLITSTAASALAVKIKESCKGKGWSLVGPAPSLVTRVAGKSRWQLLLHGPESSPLPLPYGFELWKSLPKGVSLSIDPDPLQM